MHAKKNMCTLVSRGLKRGEERGNGGFLTKIKTKIKK